jgi:hypothetical protein
MDAAQEDVTIQDVVVSGKAAVVVAVDQTVSSQGLVQRAQFRDLWRRTATGWRLVSTQILKSSSRTLPPLGEPYVDQESGFSIATIPGWEVIRGTSQPQEGEIFSHLLLMGDPQSLTGQSMSYSSVLEITVADFRPFSVSVLGREVRSVADKYYVAKVTANLGFPAEKHSRVLSSESGTLNGLPSCKTVGLRKDLSSHAPEGVEHCWSYTVLISGDKIYVITFCALPENYDTLEPIIQKVIESFSITTAKR